MAAKTLSLTIYLIKEDKVGAFEQRFPRNATDAKALPEGLDGWFIPIQSGNATPSWALALNEYVGESLGLTSQSPAGVLIIKLSGRTYVITFGHAWQKLENDWVERDFGRRVALNLIHKNKLLELRTEQVFAGWHIAMDRAPRGSTVDQFGVEFDRDLVAAVEGVPADEKKMGKTIRGGTSLRLLSTLPALPAFLDRAEKLFKSEKYKSHWPDIDNLSPVRDPATIADLEALLDSELTSGTAVKNLVLFTPFFRRDEPFVVDSYVFGRMAAAPATTPYLTPEQWYSYLDGRQLTPSIEQARQTAVHLLTAEGEEARKCSVFECLGYEVSHQGKPYILSSGSWYEVVPTFLGRVNRVVNSLRPSAVPLPGWNQTDTEGQHNAAWCKHNGFAFFDAKNIMYGGGQSKFEFCDVLHLQSKSLFFAKIVSRSAGMSHLIEQVRRTAELFFGGDAAYRKELMKVVKKQQPTMARAWTEDRARPGQWKLCLVSLGRPAKTLPFFAKCGLMNLVNDLRRNGHEVSFTDV